MPTVTPESNYRFAMTVGLLTLALLAGCEQDTNPGPIAPPPIAPAQPAAAAPATAAAPQPAAPVAPPSVAAAAPAADEMERKKAEVGVGKAGQGIEYQLGTTAVKTYFVAREKTVFDMQVPHTLNLYRAEHGYGPRSHDEFMRDIIQAGQIELPTLPPGERYVWDPDKQELFVEHKQPKP